MTTLREARERKGLTQAQVADMCQMTRAHYGLVEQRRSGLRPELAARVAVVLELTLAEVLGVDAP